MSIWSNILTRPVGALALLLGGNVAPGATAAYRTQDHYARQDVMIPMRDGIKLYTQIYAPKDAAEKYPLLLFRTPYAVGDYAAGEFKAVIGPTNDFAQEGYIVAYQDVRGKFQSEGEFIHHPTYLANKTRPDQVDESTDAYDTIEWLLKNVPNHNGRVGTWGISAPGYCVSMTMISRHPALKAASPQASPGIEFLGDDYRHYGAFRPTYALGWTYTNASARARPEKPFDYGTPDRYKFFLELGSMANVNARYFHGQNAAWNEYVDHPDYDQFWQDKDVARQMKDIPFAVLNVIGWFDTEDYYGPWAIYRSIEKNNPTNQNHVVVGPWGHGGWGRGDGSHIGAIDFGANTSEHFRANIQFPFFNYYLKDKGSPPAKKVTVFATGSNAWHQYDAWPPRGTTRRLYLQPGGRLTFNPPTEHDAFDEYLSDPAKPVPHSAAIRPDNTYMVEDQRFAARRPDVLVYQSAPLAEDTTIAGSIITHLFFSTTGTDADFVVKLIDVFPSDTPDPQPNPLGVTMGDYQMLLVAEPFRARYLKDFSKPEPLQPGVVTQLSYDLLDKFHTFKKGHRLMVQIQSSWFPLVDRNPQKFVKNIELAGDDDFQKATHRIYRSARQPTHVELNVLAQP
ncbi:MAG: CocE/NonD family hydrolase [Opitutus sp.]|nr:CocE/NonD family hydrolase [Opitutus sp.]